VKTLLCIGAVIACVIRSCPVRAEADEQYYMGEVARLSKELSQAKLGQIAMVVDSTSKAESNLRIWAGSSADPKVGHVVRAMDWGDMPFISAYQASEPVKTKLDGIGEGRILGTLALLVPASTPGGKEKADAGVYMVFLDEPTFIGTTTIEQTLHLVSVSVDKDGKPTYADALTFQAEMNRLPGVAGGIPGVMASFPGKDKVSEDNPAWRATVTMLWKEINFRFYLDLDIAMV
jgi:hypothetical protein